MDIKSKTLDDIQDAIDSPSNEFLKFEKYIKVSDFIIYILSNTAFRAQIEIKGKTQVYIYKYFGKSQAQVKNVIDNEIFLILLNLQEVADFDICSQWLVQKRYHQFLIDYMYAEQVEAPSMFDKFISKYRVG